MPTFKLSRFFPALFLSLSLAPAFAAEKANRPESPEADALTKALIERRLSQDDLALYHRLDVAVLDGVAMLRGTARTRQARDAILREVEKVAGVLAVQNAIEIEPAP
ncbi:MAG: BON domain-containing protein [Rhodanobacteraceae bacterium]|nr:BON domain-containing protein [Rhodanobacteraceae bacterium]